MTLELRGHIESIDTIPKLLDHHQAAKRCKYVSAETLLRYAKEGLAPCVWVEENGPYFFGKDISNWVKDNLFSLQEGRSLKALSVCVEGAKAPLEDIPPDLLSMGEMLRMVPCHSQMSGVYFLIKDSKVQYVGQSKNIMARVVAHTDKDFDRAFYIRVPLGELSNVEGFLIKHLRPELNGDAGPSNNNEVSVRKFLNMDDEDQKTDVPEHDKAT